jgi:hypothetical protein
VAVCRCCCCCQGSPFRAEEEEEQAGARLAAAAAAAAQEGEALAVRRRRRREQQLAPPPPPPGDHSQLSVEVRHAWSAVVSARYEWGYEDQWLRFPYVYVHFISGSYHQIFSAQARDVLDDIASNGLAADKSGWSTQQLKAFSELQVSRKD